MLWRVSRRCYLPNPVGKLDVYTHLPLIVNHETVSQQPKWQLLMLVFKQPVNHRRPWSCVQYVNSHIK